MISQLRERLRKVVQTLCIVGASLLLGIGVGYSGARRKWALVLLYIGLAIAAAALFVYIVR